MFLALTDSSLLRLYAGLLFARCANVADVFAPSPNFDLGSRGELLAAAFIQQLGFQLVAANFVLPVGRNRNGVVINVELDLVAYEKETLSFIEVKTRASDWFAEPTANVDLRKQRQVTRAARAYRKLFGLLDQPYRYDVVSIVMPADGLADVDIKLMRGFWTEDRFRKSRWQEIYWD